MRSRSPSRGRDRSRTRSPTPRSAYSRSPSLSRSRSRSRTRSPPRRRRSDSRSLSLSPRRNGRFRSDSRSLSRGRDGRAGSEDPLAGNTKIVVERLSKTINEDHLYEIFGTYGRITDLDLPINRSSNTNRGTAYILFERVEDAESAVAHLHEAQVDGATINVSIVIPRRKLSPAPPTARRGANIDPRVPFGGGRGGGPAGRGGAARRRPSPGGGRFGGRGDAYRPGTHSPSRSSIVGGGHRYRSISRGSVDSRSRSRSPRRRGGGGDRFDERDRKRRTRSRSYSMDSRERSMSAGRG